MKPEELRYELKMVTIPSYFVIYRLMKILCLMKESVTKNWYCNVSSLEDELNSMKVLKKRRRSIAPAGLMIHQWQKSKIISDKIISNSRTIKSTGFYPFKLKRYLFYFCSAADILL